jgi:hypothetical protein
VAERTGKGIMAIELRSVLLAELLQQLSGRVRDPAKDH